MAVTDVRQTVLQIINKVEDKMAINQSGSLSTTKYTGVLLDLLNEVVDELTDAGDWRELFREVQVTAVSSVAQYAIQAVSASPTELVHHIYEVVVSGRIAPMYNMSISDIKRLNRLKSFGVSNQFSVVSVDSSANPVIEVYPVPGSTQAGKLYTVSYFAKPALYTTSDANTLVIFPAVVVWRGLHAYALLEENGGEPNNQSTAAFQLFAQTKQQAINRFTSDTGFEFRMIPERRGRP